VPLVESTENSSRKTATDGEANNCWQKFRAAGRVVQETLSPRLEQFVNKRAFAHESDPGVTLHSVAFVPKQSAPQQTSPQNGAGFVIEGVELEHPLYAVDDDMNEPTRSATILRLFLSNGTLTADGVDVEVTEPETSNGLVAP